MLQDTSPKPAGSGNRYVTALKKAYDRFVKIRGNPKEIALGFALGVFVSLTPYMGFHMAMAVFFAALFKWNKIAAAMGAWVSNPLTAPFVYGATFYVGKKILNIDNACCIPHALDMDVIVQLIKNAPEIFWILTVGGIVVGIPAAVLGYYIALSAILKYRRNIREKIVRHHEEDSPAADPAEDSGHPRKREP